MAEYLWERAADIVARLAIQFHRTASHVVMLLLNHKSAGSLGTLAGFAIAVAFTWKFFRFPKGKRITGGRQLRSPAATTSHFPPSSAADSTAEENLLVGTSSSSELLSQYKPSLQLSVGNKLKGIRKMTCRLLGVVFEENTPEELQKHASMRPSVVEVLSEIAKHCDLYLMETVVDDESEARALSALENAGLFEAGGLLKDKVLFCSTDQGRISFVRQLESDWHIDSSSEIVSMLSRFVRHQLYIGTMELTSNIPNVEISFSLEQYFMYE